MSVVQATAEAPALSAGEGGSSPGRSASAVVVNGNYDSGNIEVVSISGPAGGSEAHVVELKIRPDPFCESDKSTHMQWFFFRVANTAGETLNVRIVNAGQASFVRGWRGYNVCASYDKKSWFRVRGCAYGEEDGVLSWTHTPAHGAVYYAYFAPYPYEKHQELVAEMQAQPGVALKTLGTSLDGRDMDLLQFGSDEEDGSFDDDGEAAGNGAGAGAGAGAPPAPRKRRIWVVARQHPGETMAEWFMEGLMRRLLDPADPTSRKLLRTCVFYCVPCMCPDGAFRGHLRTNAAGTNLNREWAEPSAERSPEVLCVRNAMDAVGCDLLVDVHGDEALPFNFLVDNRSVPSWTEQLAELQRDFLAAFMAASPDMQSQMGYGYGPPGSANLALCSKQVGHHFGCLSVTLEMPFKDNSDLPEPEKGWSPERSMRLGASMLEAVLAVAPRLR